MHDILQGLSKLGIVPVIKLDHAKDAAPLAKALCEGGLPCAEITFRTAVAEASIRIMAEQFPNMLVGAGTVLNKAQVDSAVKAGAKFIVSPGLNPSIVQYCIEKGIPVVPGCATPSDIERALELGLDAVKFFPAEALGGLSMIKAMAAPYAGLKFMPTGGIHAKNLGSYLEFDRILACGGSWMASPELIAAGDFDSICKLAKEAVSTMLGFELAHILINTPGEKGTDPLAGFFSAMLGFEKKSGNSSIFMNAGKEFIKKESHGANGHITIRTNDITRAVFHIQMQGLRFRQDTAAYTDKGKLKAICLEEEAGGFAVHLVQK